MWGITISPIEILWSRFGKGMNAPTHTHKEGCGQRVPQLEIDPQNDRFSDGFKTQTR